MRDKAVEVLTSAALEPIVDFVAWVDGPSLHVANAAGHAVYAEGSVVSVEGRDPIGNTDPLAFTPLSAEPAHPRNADNHYPDAAARLMEVFRDERAPDLVVVHTPSHYWPERGGHPGEHGSLDAVQSRAPLLLAGAGVTQRGIVDETRRVRDVHDLLLDLAGRVPHVIGLLWDGTNCNDLLALATSGVLPNVERLLDRGFAYRGGAIAEFPSVTLTNHASALTGVGPGTHGVLNNIYFDRATGQRLVANDITTWHSACDLLRPGVQTVFERLPDRPTAAVNEPIDRGATYSTFGLVRDAGHSDGANSMVDQLPDPRTDLHSTQRWVEADKDYAFSSAVDALGLVQAAQLWSDDALRPALMWWNVIVTDSAHHGGGPHSEEARAGMADSDRRLGVLLDLVEASGLEEQTAFLLTSDHGSEAADPDCRGDWDAALRAAGIEFRDEAYGFVYLEA